MGLAERSLLFWRNCIWAITLALANEHLYINGDFNESLVVKDLNTSPTSPSTVYTISNDITIASYSTDMLVVGSHLYTTTSEGELIIHQIAPFYATGTAADGSTAFFELHDNMGNHTAIQNLQLASSWLSNDGDDEGISIADNGEVITSGNLKIGNRLTINDNYSFPTADGMVGQVITTDGNGNLSWADVSANPNFNFRTVSETQQTTVLVQELQNQQQIIEQQQRQIDAQQAEIEALKMQVAKIEVLEAVLGRLEKE